MPQSQSLVRHRQYLAECTSKYLKFLSQVRSASVNTSKSYAIDLRQFLHPWGIKILPAENNSVGFEALCPSLFKDKTWTEKDLLDLAHQSLLNWADLKASSRNRKVATLKSLFKWLFEEGYLSSPLQDQLKAPKVPQVLPHFLSLDEVMSLFQSLKDDLKDKKGEVQASQEMTLFLLIYGGGLRVSEVCGIKWKQINLEKAQLRIEGKGGKERMVSLPQMAIEWLKSQKAESEFVFGEKPLHPRTAYEWVRQRGAKAQLLKPLHPHALRHSYATHLLSGGMDLRILQEALGHSSLVATQKYTHLGVEQLARSLQAHHPLAKMKK